jgi:hypothetical protein
VLRPMCSERRPLTSEGVGRVRGRLMSTAGRWPQMAAESGRVPRASFEPGVYNGGKINRGCGNARFSC